MSCFLLLLIATMATTTVLGKDKFKEGDFRDDFDPKEFDFEIVLARSMLGQLRDDMLSELAECIDKQIDKVKESSDNDLTLDTDDKNTEFDFDHNALKRFYGAARTSLYPHPVFWGNKRFGTATIVYRHQFDGSSANLDEDKGQLSLTFRKCCEDENNQLEEVSIGKLYDEDDDFETDTYDKVDFDYELGREGNGQITGSHVVEIGANVASATFAGNPDVTLAFFDPSTFKKAQKAFNIPPTTSLVTTELYESKYTHQNQLVLRDGKRDISIDLEVRLYYDSLSDANSPFGVPLRGDFGFEVSVEDLDDNDIVRTDAARLLADLASMLADKCAR